MVESQVWIKAHRQCGQRAILGQHAVRQGEHGVDGIGWRTAVAVAKVEVEGKLPVILPLRFETRQIVFNFDHAAELLKILTRGGTLDSK